MSRAGVWPIVLVTVATAFVTLAVAALIWRIAKPDPVDPTTVPAIDCERSPRGVLRAAAGCVPSADSPHLFVGVAAMANVALSIPQGTLEERLGERGVSPYARAGGVETAAVTTPENAMLYA
ncbi:MAG TPA: hypothetical protein VF624_13090 [Tepidisphaeraceae bacterium]|jgi:hypothetical protein